MAEFADETERFMAERGMSLRGLAKAAHYDPSLLSKVLNGHRPCSPYLATRLDRPLGAGGQIENAARQQPPKPRRARAPRRPSRVFEALQATMGDDAAELDIAGDGLAELVSHHATVVSVAPSAAVYDELLSVRSFAGSLLGR
jgi:Helix-turn-helix domain